VSTSGSGTSSQFGFDEVDLDTVRARRTFKWHKYGPDVLAAWVAEMDFPTAPVVLAALSDAVRRESFGYPLEDAHTGLPEAFAHWSAARYGWTVDPGAVHLLPDVLTGVGLALAHSTRPGSPVVLPTPAYMPFFDLIPSIGRTIIEVPVTAMEGRAVLDLDHIDAAFAGGAGSVVLCNPYNPVGRSFTTPELEDLSRVVDRHGAYVVSDEIHAPLTYPGGRHVPYASISPLAASHSITLSSASKAWNLPGLKCALAVTTAEADQARWQAFTVEAQGATTLGIEAGVAAFTNGGPWLDALLDYLDATRRWLPEMLAHHLPGVRCMPPEATYLAWLDCAELELPVDPALFFLERARVAVNEGTPFGRGFERFVRLNLATSRPILERIVTAMGTALADWRSG